MKNVILILVALISLNGFAQKRGGEKLNPEQMATLQTKKMTSALDLNESQQTKVYQLNLENATNRQAKRDDVKALKASGERKKPTSDEQYAMQTAMLDHQIAQKDKMKAILNKDQFAKWEKMQEQRKGKMKKREGQKKGRNKN
ncbi:MAG: DUF4890 domain-containing protein [Cellulophaga sp.]|nr:DUF4890 domain-containing protein [Cellulophaga sp.]